MALPARITKLEEVGEGFRSEYKEVEGGGAYVLDVSPVDGLSLTDPTPLKSALTAERNGNKSLKGLLAKLGVVDEKGSVSDKAEETVTSLLAEAERARRYDEKQPTLKERVDEGVAEYKRQWKAERDALLKQNDSLTSQIDELLVESQGFSALMGVADLDESSAKILLPHLAKLVKVRQTERGRREVYLPDKNGDPEIEVDRDGSARNLGIEDAVRKMKAMEMFRHVFNGRGLRGSDARPHSGSPGSPPSKFVFG